MKTFRPRQEAELSFVVDETLERRQGKKIVYKGWFRDAVRSTGNKVAVSLGIRWCCLCLLVTVPWAKRKWALPFLCVPVLSEKTCKRLGKPHKSGIAWTIWMLQKLRVWYPDAKITLLGDGGFAAVELVATCQQLNIKLISRLRTDAQLYAFAGPQPQRQARPQTAKGRSPALPGKRSCRPENALVSDAFWRGTAKRSASIGYRTGVCLWHTPGPKARSYSLGSGSVSSQRRSGQAKSALSARFSFRRNPAVSAEEISGRLCGPLEYRSNVRGNAGASGF